MAQRDKEYKRLELLFKMLVHYLDRAYSDVELGMELDTHDSNVWRIRRIMADELEIPLQESPDQRGKYFIRKDFQMRYIHFSPEEMASLYLAARRLQQQTKTNQEHVSLALQKLANAMRKPFAESLIKAAQVVTSQEQDAQQESIFSTLIECWLEQVPVRITHRKLHGEPRVYRVYPYQIEPAVWGDGNYLIGYSEYHGKLATFKLSRIEKAVMGTGKFEIPAEFNVHDLLKYAWGVWHADEEPVTVKLRFTKWAVPRLRESIWHPTAVLHDPAEDGSCAWEVQVAEWREMESWVKGWGADVTVEEPQALRDKLIEEIKRMGRRYGIIPEQPLPKLWRLWAKTDRDTKEIHRLVYHLIDVGYMALAVWEHSLHPKLKQQISNWLFLPPQQIGAILAFWASLHDLGKASPAFQDHPRMDRKLNDDICAQLGQVGLRVAERGSDRHARHEVITTWSLRELDGGEGLLRSCTTIPGSLAELIAQMLGGHHGAWPDASKFDPKNLKRDDQGDQAWADVRRELVEQMAAIFQPPPIDCFAPAATTDNLTLALISAITSVADWIASDDVHFHYKAEFEDAAVYARKAAARAVEVIHEIDWQTAPNAIDFDFTSTFGFASTIAQDQIITTLSGSSLPTLAIIEAQMGIGKTEMSLATYAHWAQATSGAGLYMAMPTTATSNQMHRRVDKFLSKQFGAKVDPMLVHSQALLMRARVNRDPVEEAAHEGDQAAAQSWFLPRKKSLLWPFSVGTVDQALMSILQTKHFFVRLLGLSHKVVIFDEVHAYDAYMSVLFERLLLWLHQIGASVIILSATLPDATRQRLLAAYTGHQTVGLPEGEYPRLSFVDTSDVVKVIPLRTPSQNPLAFDWLGRDFDSILERLEDELHHGGCAAIICNTVTRAQQLYEEVLKRPDLCPSADVLLFHARFPMAWREDKENKVLDRFGPHPDDKRQRNPNRPQKKTIVIATQVIEQSLDLDFDVMISDHAPVDLLLQRAGRLHRHRVNDATRRHTYCLLIAEPEVTDGVPKFERSDTYVYDEYVLLRSWQALHQIGTKKIEMPVGMSTLIEQVYSEQTLSEITPQFEARLKQAKRDMEKTLIDAEDAAGERVVEKPSYKQFLFENNLQLDEDDPKLHAAFRALTRNDPPGVNIVCLHRVGDRLLLDPEDGTSEYEPSRKPDEGKIIEMLRHSLAIRHPDPLVEAWLLDPSQSPTCQAILARWKRISALRYHRVVIFENGVCRLHGTPYVMTLNRDLGIKIKKESV